MQRLSTSMSGAALSAISATWKLQNSEKPVIRQIDYGAGMNSGLHHSRCAVDQRGVKSWETVKYNSRFDASHGLKYCYFHGRVCRFIAIATAVCFDLFRASYARALSTSSVAQASNPAR